MRLWLDEPDPAEKAQMETKFLRGWWNEKSGGLGYIKGCKKCHCADPSSPFHSGCVPYNFLIFPTINNVAKAANHLGLLLDRSDGPPVRTLWSVYFCAVANALYLT